jgi:hypothetical protein
MPLPKKIKKNIPLTESKILLPRRQELLDKINKDGTFLPKSILHADLDGGFLDFVKDELKLIVDGKLIPTIDIIITTQNWAQFVETWEIQNIDNNVEPPFVTIVRKPEVKYGTNPSTIYNIPNRRQFFYAQVPTWDGQRMGADIYKIPQPVPVDISFEVKIICNRMRELNQFNKIILEKFASRQAYQVIKGHYIPIIMGDISDESVLDLNKRKYYIQSYSFTLLGFLIDENEFEVSPAISRVLQVLEVDTRTIRRRKKQEQIEQPNNFVITYNVGTNVLSQTFNYTTNTNVIETNNITSYDLYINNNFYGTNLSQIQINTNDVVRIEITRDDINSVSSLTLSGLLL